MEPLAQSWVWAAAGGALIGLSAALYLVLEGRIAGISGMVAATAGLAPGPWHALPALFLAGVMLGAGAASHLIRTPVLEMTQSWVLIVLAGGLVGIGTRLGGGCTSGHGVCGLARLSPRSIVATLIFMGVAALTVYVVRHIAGSLS